MSGCSPKQKFVLDPALLDAIGACCSSYSVATAEDGTVTIVMDPGDGSAPTTVVIGPGAVSTVTFDPATGTYTHDDGQGNTESWQSFPDTWSTTIDNGDGTFTTTNPDGSQVTWTGDTFASVADNGDGSADITFADGTTITVCLAPCGGADTDTFGMLVDNGDGTYTWTSADGATSFDIPKGSTSSVTYDAATGEYTHDDGNGNTETWGGLCSIVGCATAPDGSLVIVTTIDGVTTYTTPSGAAWTGTPGALV